MLPTNLAIEGRATLCAAVRTFRETQVLVSLNMLRPITLSLSPIVAWLTKEGHTYYKEKKHFLNHFDAATFATFCYHLLSLLLRGNTF
jgi:hypothetical protein